MYFGLDGDNTGAILEDLFLAASDEKSFKRISEVVDKAIKEIVRIIRDRVPRSRIIFAAGDDILFKGCCDRSVLQSLQSLVARPPVASRRTVSSVSISSTGLSSRIRTMRGKRSA